MIITTYKTSSVVTEIPGNWTETCIRPIPHSVFSLADTRKRCPRGRVFMASSHVIIVTML
jgi:hypothetical protein